MQPATLSTTLASHKRLLLGVIFAWNDVTFVQISRKLQLRSQTRLFVLKANEQTFSTIYCPYRNIVNFSRTSRIHSYLKIRHSDRWGRKTPKTTLPVGARRPYQIHPSIDRPGYPITIPNGIQIQSAILPQYTFPTDRLTDRQMGLTTSL